MHIIHVLRAAKATGIALTSGQPLTIDIHKKASTGIKWTSLSTFSKVAIQVSQLIIVARVLGPEALGLLALVQFSLAIGQLAIDMGIGNAIIHFKNGDSDTYKELGAISVILSIFLSLMTWWMSPYFSAWMSAPTLAPLLEQVSVVFVIMGISRVNFALLQKELAFTALAKLDIVAFFTGFVATIFMLFSDVGISSVIWGYLLQQFVLSSGYFLLTKGKLYFSAPKSFSKVKSYLAFGAYQTADAVTNFVNSQIDVLIIGKLLGTEALGAYHLVRQLCFRPAMVINPIVTRVAFPYFSKLDSKENLKRIYKQVLALLSTINSPLFVGILVFASPLITVLFGKEWEHLEVVMQLMAIWCLLRAYINPVGSLMMATGKVRRLFIWNLFLTCIFPIAIFIGALQGLKAVVVALIVAQVFSLVGHWWFLLRPVIGITMNEYCKASGLPLVIALGAFIPAVAFTKILPEISELATLLIGVVISSILYLLLSVRMNPSVSRIINTKTIFDSDEGVS